MMRVCFGFDGSVDVEDRDRATDAFFGWGVGHRSLRYFDS